MLVSVLSCVTPRVNNRTLHVVRQRYHAHRHTHVHTHTQDDCLIHIVTVT